MLEYVWYSRGVRRVCLETNAEHIVLVVPCYMQVIRSCLVMLEMERRQLQFRNMFHPLECEAMESCSRLWEGVEVCDGGVRSGTWSQKTARVWSNDA